MLRYIVMHILHCHSLNSQQLSLESIYFIEMYVYKYNSRLLKLIFKEFYLRQSNLNIKWKNSVYSQDLRYCRNFWIDIFYLLYLILFKKADHLYLLMPLVLNEK